MRESRISEYGRSGITSLTLIQRTIEILLWPGRRGVDIIMYTKCARNYYGNETFGIRRRGIEDNIKLHVQTRLLDVC